MNTIKSCIAFNKNIKNILFSIIFLLFIFFMLDCPAFCFSEDEINKQEDENLPSNIIDPTEPSILKGHISKVPGGTKIKIIIESPIDELTSKVGDEITARTSEDIVIDEKIVVSAGSTVLGTISEINSAKRLHKAGNVRLEFKNLTTPDGREIPIVASVLTHSGLLKGKYTKKTTLITGATLATPVVAGLGAGLVADGSALGATVGAAIGAISGLALFAFQRGNKVDVKAGDELSIELTEEALIPALSETKPEEVQYLNENNEVRRAQLGVEAK